MKDRKCISIICIIALLSSLCMIPASANSAAPSWEGTDGNGVFIKDGDIPIVVENELLTFDLPTLPYAKYRDSETFLAYDSKVTAEYTFYNPSDLTITATLFFPFDSHPDYGSAPASEVLEKYGVYINDEKVDLKIRHTFRYTDNSYTEMSINDILATLSDELVEDDFYSPDLTVTKYSYEVVGHSIPSAYFNVKIDSVGSERKILLYDGRIGGYITETGSFSMSTEPSEGEKQISHFYVLGKPLETEPRAAWLKRNGTDPDTLIDGEFQYLGSETMSFNDLVFSAYNPGSGISEVDWYNAAVARLNQQEEKRLGTSAIRAFFFEAALRWYEYKIVLKPGERIKNTVVSPMYPTINALKKPYRYRYTYLLSPASCWANFGKLEIVINTPYEMSKCSIEGFEKTENGYRFTSDGLPKDEDGYADLYFTLLNDGNTPLKQPGIDSEGGFFKSAISFFKNILHYITESVKTIYNRLFK